MSKAGRRTKRHKSNAVAGQSGPSIADYYRYKLSVPNPTAPTYEEYQAWRTQAL